MAARRARAFSRVGVCGIAALALAACGSAHHASRSSSSGDRAHQLPPPAPSRDHVVSGQTLTIYSSAQLQGAQQPTSQSVDDAELLALEQAQGRVGRYRVRLVELDNSTSDSGTWNAATVRQNAQQAASDQSTIAYLGEDSSPASMVSIPVLNRAGILQVSPTASADALTVGSASAMAQLYPTRRRTFARLVPADSVQAAAQAQYQQQEGCTKVYVLSDGTPYGQGLASEVTTADQANGITVVGRRTLPAADGLGKLIGEIGSASPDCVFYGGGLHSDTVALWRALARVAGSPRLFGADQLANEGFTTSIGSAGEQTFLTSPGLAQSAYGDLGQRFFEAYEARFGGFPTPEAIFGYEAMKAVLAAIAAAGPNAGDRAAVIRRFFAIRNRTSVLGTYSIQADGNTTLDVYGAYTVSQGALVFSHVLTPAAL